MRESPVLEGSRNGVGPAGLENKQEVLGVDIIHDNYSNYITDNVLECKGWGHGGTANPGIREGWHDVTNGTITPSILHKKI